MKLSHVIEQQIPELKRKYRRLRASGLTPRQCCRSLAREYGFCRPGAVRMIISWQSEFPICKQCWQEFSRTSYGIGHLCRDCRVGYNHRAKSKQTWQRQFMSDEERYRYCTKTLGMSPQDFAEGLESVRVYANPTRLWTPY